ERWTKGLERRVRRALRHAAGVQCNGTPTYEAYRSLTPRPLLYFDSRVTESLLTSDADLQARGAELIDGAPLRLAFSGRLIPMKGADHLPKVAAELKRLGVPFRMDIFGDGDLAGDMKQQIAALGLADVVHMRGVLDFQSGLMPFVARNIDLFVCCHRQGDPSCTYLETMACGTPIVGYDNEAAAGIVRNAGVGWLSPPDDPGRLAAMIAELNEIRPLLIEAAEKARAFAARHTLDQTMQARVDHMLTCCRDLEFNRERCRSSA
ncbi:MAG: glycosyltransferase, partial [Phycisphaerales bacterium]